MIREVRPILIHKLFTCNNYKYDIMITFLLHTILLLDLSTIEANCMASITSMGRYFNFIITILSLFVVVT